MPLESVAALEGISASGIVAIGAFKAGAGTACGMPAAEAGSGAAGNLTACVWPSAFMEKEEAAAESVDISHA